MYYRVKQFSETYKNMFVIDSDIDLTELKKRDKRDCAKNGYKSFDNPKFVETQEIRCTSLGGQVKKTDIIKEADI